MMHDACVMYVHDTVLALIQAKQGRCLSKPYKSSLDLVNVPSYMFFYMQIHFQGQPCVDKQMPKFIPDVSQVVAWNKKDIALVSKCKHCLYRTEMIFPFFEWHAQYDITLGKYVINLHNLAIVLSHIYKKYLFEI